VLLLILLGVGALVVLVRAVAGFVYAVWGTKDALNNRGFARRYWNYHKFRRRKKAPHHRER
jgi:hypothetical protein